MSGKVNGLGVPSYHRIVTALILILTDGEKSSSQLFPLLPAESVGGHPGRSFAGHSSTNVRERSKPR